MNTKLIEQIKQIKGVKTVIPSGETCVVTFEPEENTLGKYEDSLLGDGGDKFIIYQWLKANDPGAYWLKVLKLIADDLNKCCISDGVFHIAFDRKSGYPDVIGVSMTGRTPGEVVFYSKDAAKTAIRIMGDKLKFLNEK